VQESYGGGEFGQGSKVARVSNVVFAHALNRRSGGNRNWPIGVGGVPMPRWGGASVAPTFTCVNQVCAVLKHEQGDTSREKGLSSPFPLV
jgi:hypothetical protein